MLIDEHAHYTLKDAAKLSGLPTFQVAHCDAPAPIVSFGWGKRADMQALQRRVFEQGIYIYHSSYIGSGPDGLIRCAVFRDHSKEDIDALIDALK